MVVCVSLMGYDAEEGHPQSDEMVHRGDPVFPFLETGTEPG